MEYSVVVNADGGFWVHVPALPGCYSQGKTVAEAIDHVREAIELYLDVPTERGEAGPRDADVVFRVSVPA
ncbi:MAG: type II toxin-antitoxin system HicB family antitoxin [Dehalococcoidia bacterium]|nr:type II toxin-antitoxin system HicB family antitoxin [Dehalococcoidia bacterium]